MMYGTNLKLLLQFSILDVDGIILVREISKVLFVYVVFCILAYKTKRCKRCINWNSRYVHLLVHLIVD